MSPKISDRRDVSNPVFIGGLSFSGKTTLRLYLSSHPNLAISRRTYMWPRFYERYGELSQPENFERCLQAMLAQKSILVLKPDPAQIRREFWLGPPTYARLFALFHEHFAEKLGKRRWGDQLKLVERFADPIFAAYPNAKMIHMIRDPNDRYQAATPKQRRWTGKVGWVMADWLRSADLAKRNLERYSDRYRVVNYEALLARREQTVREICAFLEEDFMPSMLTGEEAIRFGSKKTNQIGDVSRAAMTVSPSIQPPHAEIPRRELAFTQTYARRQLLEFGYSLKPLRLTLGDRLLFNLVDRPANLASMFAWRTLQTLRS